LQGYEMLRGRPAAAKWFRFMARLHQHRAWFRVHCGMSTTAFQEAKIAIDLSHLAYREKLDPIDLRRMTEACLIASNACLLGGDPRSSLKLLDLASQGSERIFDSLGSEHHKQRAVALFQLGEDTEAAKYSHAAAVAMQEKNEARNAAHLAMTGDRHLAVLGKPNLEMAEDVLKQVNRDFAWTSLEHVMTLNWAGACGLMTGSGDNHVLAQDHLRASLDIAARRYGHQTTVAKLLVITPDLGLDRRFWNDWVRRALYENASKAD
jgi:hypothetical protein